MLFVVLLDLLVLRVAHRDEDGAVLHDDFVPELLDEFQVV